MLAEGKYFGAIKSAVTSKAKTGKPQMEIKVVLTHALDAQGNYVGLNPVQERRCFLPLGDTAWEYSEKKLKALGFKGNFDAPEFASNVTVGGDNNGAAPGTEWLVRHDTYSGTPKEKIELANWGESQQADKSVIKQLSAKWGSANKTQPVPAGRPPSPPTRTAPAPRPAAPVTGGVAPVVTAGGSPAAVVEINSKDTAWAAYCDQMKNQPDLKAWSDAVASVAATAQRDKLSFTPDDWQQVLATLEIPF